MQDIQRKMLSLPCSKNHDQYMNHKGIGTKLMKKNTAFVLVLLKPTQHKVWDITLTQHPPLHRRAADAQPYSVSFRFLGASAREGGGRPTQGLLFAGV